MAATNDSGFRVGELIAEIAEGFGTAGLFFGHGTASATDEAAALVYFVCGLEHDGDESVYERPVAGAQVAEIRRLAEVRRQSRKPLPYLTGEAWFCGLPFEVDERVLVPRSPLAELITDRFEPWLDPEQIDRVLEIGTGSGCIAVAIALALPYTRVVATDISPEALAVAGRNVARHGVGGRVDLLQADHSAGVTGVFDLIVSNPPYVPEAEAAVLPAEYGHEPSLGLYSGADGLDSARRILQDARQLLTDRGALVLEVGAQWQALEQAFPSLPFTWLEFESGGEGVALLTGPQLRAGLAG